MEINQIVKLSQAQYDTLKANGSLTVGDTTILYEPETTIYVTPSAPNIDLTDYVKKEEVDGEVKDSLVNPQVEWSDDDKKAVRTLIGATNLNTHANYGIQNNNTGLAMIVKATDDEITNRSTAYKPIVPSNLDYAIVQGLVNNANILTSEQKKAIQSWLDFEVPQVIILGEE